MKVFLSLLLDIVVIDLRQVIKNVFTEHYTSLYETTGNSLQLLTDEMYAAGFITIHAPDSFSFAEIFYEFQAGLSLMMSAHYIKSIV